MTDNRTLTLTDLPQDIYTKAMPEAEISEKDLTYILSHLSSTCKNFSSLFKIPLVQLAVQKLLQSIIDDDHRTVKKILNTKPGILLITPSSKWVITSQLTGRQYYAKDALKMACQLRQANMVKLLLSYYNELTQSQAVIDKKAEALAAWPFYKIEEIGISEKEIIIPSEYILTIESIIEIFLKNDHVGQMNPQIKTAILSLTEQLKPKQIIDLDNPNDYLDTELLLLAVYKVYKDKYFTVFNSDMQDIVELFCQQIMFKIQQAVMPDIAKIHCHGLTNVYNALTNGKELKLTIYADNCLMQRENYLSRFSERFFNITYLSFYNPSSSPCFNTPPAFFCDIQGKAVNNIKTIHFAYNMFQFYLQHKQDFFVNLCLEAAALPESIISTKHTAS